MDLFSEQAQAARRRVQPLAVRMRPRSLDEFVGQAAILGPGKLLRRLVEGQCLTSAVFYGPPGTGKTTLARLIAQHARAEFETLHAAEATVRDVRAIIEAAHGRLTAGGRRTILFLDEIHRFNRAQQDVLLRDVEEGTLVLVGATTENPFFALNSPLISRSHVFEFEPLTVAELELLLRRALDDCERGLGGAKAVCDEEALRLIAAHADGDARRALTVLETAVLSQQRLASPPHVTTQVAADCLQRKVVPYDAAGDQHYDVASAFIKSMRGSAPDATLYWLARMLEGGEDPRFIARRIAICASEDVGDADPQAALLAAAAAQITELVGLPECQFALAQAAVYIACAPKSAAVTKALAAARRDVRENPTLPVPAPLRDASYPGAARLGHGQGYRSPHDSADGYTEQDYLGVVPRYYNPTGVGQEGRPAARLHRRGSPGEASSPDDPKVGA